TPKHKTLEVFGIPGAISYPNGEQRSGAKLGEGTPQPYHLYSMRQAIEEGFIMDVLKGYTTYKTYFRLNKEVDDDPRIPKKKGTAAVARFLSLHPHNLAQKTEVMIEHFRRVTQHKIGGKAKAMVVTSSRLHAVRYKQEFDRYIQEKKYTDLKTLVAFSGTVIDENRLEYTEPGMNGFPEKELPERFKGQEYGVLIVAEKYQTGFDQPLLHTMYVDKKLSGVKAVQTLSRLNRTCPGKEDTFVLDFANEAEEIRESFQPYYEMTELAEYSDPNHVYDLKTRLEQAQVIWLKEVEEFNRVYYNPYFTAKDQGKLNAFIDPAVDRFKHLPKTKEDENQIANQEDFKHTLQVFLRFYGFITQIVNFSDVELVKFYTYCRFLERKLPALNQTERFRLSGDEIALKYYRLQKMKENFNIELESKTGTLDNTQEAGLRYGKEERAPLSEIIQAVNTRFGTEFTDADRLLIEQVIEDCVQDQDLVNQAKSNTMENFKYGFDDVVITKWIERMDQNQDFFKNIMDNEKISGLINDYVMKEVYRRLRL
ncbi:MAG: type I restriction endonuclease subunit R, partial [Bacteroidota bacterium]|nr:type I restriction endonuclease subunit R [Bacteroidota bacterium]